MEVPLLHLLYCLSSCQCPYLSVCVPVIVDVCMSMCLCTQLTVIRLVMKDTIEETLYKRNNERDVAEVSLSITSSSSQHGVEVRRPYHHRHHQCRHAWHLTDADIFYCTLLFSWRHTSSLWCSVGDRNRGCITVVKLLPTWTFTTATIAPYKNFVPVWGQFLGHTQIFVIVPWRLSVSSKAQGENQILIFFYKNARNKFLTC